MKKLALLLIVFAFVAAAADFTGVWSGKADITANGEQQPSTAQLTLKQDGSTVTGTAGPDSEQQHSIQNGKADGDTLEFDIQPGDDAPLIHVKLKLEGDALRGTVKGEADGNTVEGTLELKREK